MENNRKTLVKARKVAVVANVEKGVSRLKKGVTRFVSHNRAAVGGVALGAVGLVAAGRFVSRRRSVRTGLLPRIAIGGSSMRKAFRAYGRRARMNPALSTGALVGTGALIGTGLAILFGPRWITGH